MKTNADTNYWLTKVEKLAADVAAEKARRWLADRVAAPIAGKDEYLPPYQPQAARWRELSDMGISPF